MRQVIGLVLIFVLGCSKAGEGEHAPKEGAKEGEHEGEEHGHEVLPKHVRVSAQVMEDAGIRTAAVRRESLARTLMLSGELAADPDKTADVAAPLGGIIETVLVQEGSHVKKGEVLAVVRVPELGRVRGALEAARARAVSAKAKVLRLRPLVAKSLASAQELESAEAEALALEAEARALSGELAAVGSQGQGAMISLRAPRNGLVVRREAVVGRPVSAGTVVARLVELGSAWFIARAFEQDLRKLSVGAAAEVEFNAYPGEFFGGKLEALGAYVDPSTRSIGARVVLEGEDERWRLGLFGRAAIALRSGDGEELESRLLVPRTAVIDLAGKPIVFARHAQGEANMFEVHEVVLGEGAQGKVSILSGLKEGEEVVVEGAFSLKSLVMKGVFAEEEH